MIEKKLQAGFLVTLVVVVTAALIVVSGYLDDYVGSMLAVATGINLLWCFERGYYLVGFNLLLVYILASGFLGVTDDYAGTAFALLLAYALWESARGDKPKNDFTECEE